jgi:hypothetical protein
MTPEPVISARALLRSSGARIRATGWRGYGGLQSARTDCTRRATRACHPCPICPSCQSAARISPCAVGQITTMLSRIPPRQEGRYGRSSRNVRRDAVDAAASGATTSQGGLHAHERSGERARRTALLRTVKACGPGTRCWCQVGEGVSAQPGAGALSIRRRRWQDEFVAGESTP